MGRVVFLSLFLSLRVKFFKKLENFKFWGRSKEIEVRVRRKKVLIRVFSKEKKR